MTPSAALQAAETALGAAKMFVPEQAAHRPTYPADVSNLSSQELGRLLGEYAAVLAYLEYEAARWETERTSRKAALEYERAKAYLRHRAAGKTVEDAKQMLRADDALAQATLEYEAAAGTARLVGALLSGTARQYAGLSRELSRRGLVDPTQSGREGYGRLLAGRQEPEDSDFAV
jgi:hypothetical protein